jgi:hypothetical protein
MFSQPKKTPDGLYYVKPLERKLVQLNGVKIASSTQDSVTLSLDDNTASKITAVDTDNVEAAKANSESWFTRVLPDKTIEAAYSRSLVDSNMNVSKPAFHKVYRGTELVDEPLTEGETCDVVLEFSGISFSKKAFSAVWKLVQTRLRVPPKKKYHEEYLFQDESVAENSDEDLFE